MSGRAAARPPAGARRPSLQQGAGSGGAGGVQTSSRAAGHTWQRMQGQPAALPCPAPVDAVRDPALCALAHACGQQGTGDRLQRRQQRQAVAPLLLSAPSGRLRRASAWRPRRPPPRTLGHAEEGDGVAVAISGEHGTEVVSDEPPARPLQLYRCGGVQVRPAAHARQRPRRRAANQRHREVRLAVLAPARGGGKGAAGRVAASGSQSGYRVPAAAGSGRGRKRKRQRLRQHRAPAAQVPAGRVGTHSSRRGSQAGSASTSSVSAQGHAWQVGQRDEPWPGTTARSVF